MTPILTTLAPGLLEAGSRLIDRLVPDPAEREKAKLALLQAEGQLALQEMQTSLSAILAEANSADPWTTPGTADLPLRHLRRDPAVRDGCHHRHLVANARLPGGGEPEQAAGRGAREPVVALWCGLPGLHRGAQLRQVAWASTLTGAARHDNLKRRSPDLTAFAGGGVGGFLLCIGVRR